METVKHLKLSCGVTAEITIDQLTTALTEDEQREKKEFKCWDDFTPKYSIQFLQKSYNHYSFGLSGDNLMSLYNFILSFDFVLNKKEFRDFNSLPF